uniref:Uncharacterized protein n=1 Tax=viral metagenome TaxID=1070528 RepID=A0A6C0I6P5_9ZZZZ
METNYCQYSIIELKQLVVNNQKEILALDEKSIYSLSYYYYDEGVKRAQLVAQINEINMEILYREDDEKFIKYRPMKDRDPLKYRPKKSKT